MSFTFPFFGSPFEVFRTPITIRRFTQGFYLNGMYQEGSQVVLSTAVISGNVINMTLNGVILSPTTFLTSASVTMALLKAKILLQPNISNVDVSSDNLTLTIVPNPPNLSIVNSFLITGGASQPIITITNSPTIISATASVQPIGKDVVLVPEGRRDKEVFTMYTSTFIQGISTTGTNLQNPDQITVIKTPFTGLVFETIKIDEWQNNSNFNITNHYKFICMRLNPLPNIGF